MIRLVASPAPAATPSAEATAPVTCDGSESSDRSTKQILNLADASSALTTASAVTVLPIPLGPVEKQRLARTGRQRALQRLGQRRALLVMDLEPGGEGRRERPRVPDLLERDEDDLRLPGRPAA